MNWVCFIRQLGLMKRDKSNSTAKTKNSNTVEATTKTTLNGNALQLVISYLIYWLFQAEKPQLQWTLNNSKTNASLFYCSDAFSSRKDEFSTVLSIWGNSIDLPNPQNPLHSLMSIKNVLTPSAVIAFDHFQLLIFPGQNLFTKVVKIISWHLLSSILTIVKITMENI